MSTENPSLLNYSRPLYITLCDAVQVQVVPSTATSVPRRQNSTLLGGAEGIFEVFCSKSRSQLLKPKPNTSTLYWVAVKQLKLSYY